MLINEITNEDLRKWFKDKWVNIGKKDKSQAPSVVQVERKVDTQSAYLLPKLVA